MKQLYAIWGPGKNNDMILTEKKERTKNSKENRKKSDVCMHELYSFLWTFPTARNLKSRVFFFLFYQRQHA